MPIDYDILLLPVYQEMRRLGAQVTLAEYLQAIEMLRAGIGLTDAASLKSACRLLWAKSRAEQELFDMAFASKAAIKLTILAPVPEVKHNSPPVQSDDDQPIEPVENISMQLPVKAQSLQQTKVNQPGTPQTITLPDSTPLPIDLPAQKSYHFMPRLPLAQSELAAHWRQLRRMQPVGPAEEIDIEATIQDICRHGILREPVRRLLRGNSARLLLLIDQGGSMVPFKLLIEAFVESATRTSLTGRTTLAYFHDCPGQVLYQDNHLGQPVVLEQFLAQHARNSGILIVSDAGAARAHYDDRRVSTTRHFLQSLQRYTYLYAWLNPVPYSRWRFTTAEDIEPLVPMFPLTRDGLDDAIAILRGQPFPPGVNAHA